MRNVLVTGGAGFIGSYLCKLFYENGFIPVTFDNLLLGNRWAVKWGPLEIGDLCNKKDLHNLFNKYSFDGVVHLAGFSNVSESVKNPYLYYNNNVIGSFNLLEKMIEFNVKRIVFSSTAAVYGNPIASLIDEKHPTHPINPYGDSKLSVERLIYNYSQSYGINFISLRYFNVSGSDFLSQIGEAHSPETHIIPLALEAAYQNSIFKINGNDYNTNDGTCIRDFIHLRDLGDAHLRSFQKLNTSKIGEFINVGGGKGLSVNEVIECVKKVTNVNFKTIVFKRRDGDPASLVSNINKSKKILSWSPQNSSIEKIISDSWEWYKYYKSLNLT